MRFTKIDWMASKLLICTFTLKTLLDEKTVIFGESQSHSKNSNWYNITFSNRKVCKQWSPNVIAVESESIVDNWSCKPKIVDNQSFLAKIWTFEKFEKSKVTLSASKIVGMLWLTMMLIFQKYLICNKTGSQLIVT